MKPLIAYALPEDSPECPKSYDEKVLVEDRMKEHFDDSINNRNK